MHPLLALWLKIIGASLGVLIGIIAIPALLIAVLSSGTDNLCGNSSIAEIASPSGELKAVVFGRDCGATTGFSTHISVISAKGPLPNEGGNIFAADTDHSRAPSGLGGGPEIRVTWLSDHILRVEHHQLARVFKSQTQQNGVEIEYAVFQQHG